MNESTNTNNLFLQIVAIPDLWFHHFVPFLTFHEISRCEQVCRRLLSTNDKTWQVLCQRDVQINTQQEAPDPSFQAIRTYDTWKQVYQHWHHWHQYTHHVTTTQQAMQAIRLHQNIQFYCTQQSTPVFKQSLAPPLSTTTLKTWAQHPAVPSDLVAWYAVCGGQHSLQAQSANDEFLTALLGCYACYDAFYAMRLVDANTMGPVGVDSQTHYTNNQHHHILVALSIGQPRLCVSIRKHPTTDPDGRLVRMHPLGQDATSIVVGNQGILHYLHSYWEQVMTGIYATTSVLPESPLLRGISVFPDGGDAVSVSVTHGIEVRASARWFPSFVPQQQQQQQQQQQEEEGLNFGYSIRIQMLDTSIGNRCQLVSRHWEFVNGHGTVRRVDGQAVVGKQPLFFRNDDDDTFGYHDLGPAGDDEIYTNTVFVYQSQSGPVEGTTREDTRGAHIRGFFRFVPGSIEQPTGPSFQVKVAPFPLTVPFPFY